MEPNKSILRLSYATLFIHVKNGFAIGLTMRRTAGARNKPVEGRTTFSKMRNEKINKNIDKLDKILILKKTSSSRYYTKTYDITRKVEIS